MNYSTNELVDSHKKSIFVIQESKLKSVKRFKYRYMYLKTYAKFTFCIKSQGHVSDENFFVSPS